jgi:tetratricopeptide (TPR) repeat protein
LHRATDAELIYANGIAPDARYQFKHALIRDAAYQALLKSRRKEVHLQIAQTIDEQFPAIKDAHPEVLARHWTEAGEAERAISDWARAGRAAEARNAFKEAEDSYHQALALIKLLPESAERDNRELELRQSVVSLLQIARGYAATETIASTQGTITLAEKTGNLAQLINWLNSRCAAAVQSGDLHAAIRLSDQALELGNRERNSSALGIAHMLQLGARYYAGDFAEAEKVFNVGLAFFEDPRFTRVSLGPLDAFGWASWNAWTIGHADVARKRIMQMRACAQPSNAYDVASCRWYGALLHALMREYDDAAALARQALELSDKYQVSAIAAFSEGVLGHALAQLGRPGGTELIRQGLTALLRVGSRVSIMRCATHLAEAQGREGCLVDALEMVEQALQTDPEVLAFRPEALRVRGELRLKQGQVDLAEDDFRDAIALAQKMGAKAWELRATMSLARLLRDSGRRDEARTMLAEIYGWFTEGFDTAELKDAKAFLDELVK